MRIWNRFENWLQDISVEPCPVNRLFPFFLEKVVALREVTAAQETSVGREGWRVDGLEEVVLLRVNHWRFLLRVRTPQEEDDAAIVLTEKKHIKYGKRYKHF